MVYQQVSKLQNDLNNLCHSQDTIKDSTAEIDEALKLLVNFLGDKIFILGDDVSYVDLMFFETIDLIAFLQENVTYLRYP